MSWSNSWTRSLGTGRTTRWIRTSCSSELGWRKRATFDFMPGSLKKMQPGCPAKRIHSTLPERLASIEKRALIGTFVWNVCFDKRRRLALSSDYVFQAERWPAKSLHANRTAGGHRDYCDFGSDVASRSLSR